MAFHCGVLRWLAETGRLEQVGHVSTVSGGTLIMGLVLATNRMRWPTSSEYLGEVAPRLKVVLTTADVAKMAIRLLASPSNWKYSLSRANVLSQALERTWNVPHILSELPRTPVWSINATTAETGRRFRFKMETCGDYELGYAEAGKFKLADAMAVSAALPGLIGPFAMETADYVWRRRPEWSTPAGSEQVVQSPYERLHLYDGGVYDNLGLEPLMDPARKQFKNDVGYLICSDAGAPLQRVTPGFALSPFRAKRILDIAMDQTRSLRVRALASLYEEVSEVGAYAQIGSVPKERIASFRARNPEVAAELEALPWLDAGDVAAAAAHPTTLRPLTQNAFVRLERHGYESAHWNEMLFGRRVEKRV